MQDVLRSQIRPAVEQDISAPDCKQIKSELQDNLDTEDLLREMQISPENAELDAKPVETVHIEKHARDRPVRQNNIRYKKRYIYETNVSCTKCRKKVPKSGLRAHLAKHR